MAEMREQDGTTPGCKLYFDLPFRDYSRMPGISASALKGDGRHSAKHLDAYLHGKIKGGDSPAMRFGRALHCMVLEPDRFEESFPKTTPCAAVLKSGEKKGLPCGCSSSGYKDGLWYCGKHWPEGCDEPYDFVTGDESTRLNELRESVKTSTANEYLARPGFSEAVIVWNQLGHTLKTRIDRLAIEPNRITLIDIKTCQLGRANQESAQRSCLDYGYHIAAWVHYAACRAAFGEDIEIESYFLFQESEVPYDTYLLQVSDQDLQIADRNIVNQLTRYNRGKKAGKFDGAQPFIDPAKAGMLPPWFVRQQMKGE